jgi:hypothetical protein
MTKKKTHTWWITFEDRLGMYLGEITVKGGGKNEALLKAHQHSLEKLPNAASFTLRTGAEMSA